MLRGRSSCEEEEERVSGLMDHKRELVTKVTILPSQITVRFLKSVFQNENNKTNFTLLILTNNTEIMSIKGTVHRNNKKK